MKARTMGDGRLGALLAIVPQACDPAERRARPPAACPECGSELRHAGACVVCGACGYSPCG